MLFALIAAILTQPQPTEIHTGKSGQAVFITAAKTAKVVTVPTLSVNGQAVPLVPGPVQERFWSFALAPSTVLARPGLAKGDPRAPPTTDVVPGLRAILPADVLRITAPDGWAEGFGPLNMAIRNNADRVEFAIPERPSMALGVNISGTPLAWNAGWCPIGNWARRLEAWGSEVTATNSGGDATRLAGTGAVSNFATCVFGNAVDSQSIPITPGGLYTVQWDSADPRTEFSVIDRIGDETGWLVTARPELSSPGANGVGITRVFEVSPRATSTLRTPRIALSLAHPEGKPSYSNLGIFPPGTRADRSDPYALEAWTKDILTIGAGRGPLVIRWMDACAGFGGDSNVVNPGDLTSPYPTSWAAQQRTLTASIKQLRPWDLKRSPWIYTIYGPLRTTRAQWDQPGRWLAEAVCDRPHGLSSGQTFSLATPEVKVGGGQVARSQWIAGNMWVTSPTTFLVLGQFIVSDHAVDLDAVTDTPGLTISVEMPGGAFLPFEFAAATCERLGSICWISIPAYCTDATVDEIARRLCRFKCPVAVEYSNEIWIGKAATWYCGVMATLTGRAPSDIGYGYIRQAEVAARFAAIYSREGRAGDVLSVLGVQFSWVRGLPWAASQGIKADIIAGAPYMGLPAAYGPLVESWTDAQILDLFRHELMLGDLPRAQWADWQRAVSQYEALIGRRVLKYSYEGGLSDVATGFRANQGARTWDIFAHPDIGDTEEVYAAACQANGLGCLTYFTLCNNINPNYMQFGLFQWQGQQEGAGDGSDGRPVNVPIGSSGQWRPTVSPRGRTWRRWNQDWLISQVKPAA